MARTITVTVDSTTDFGALAAAFKVLVGRAPSHDELGALCERAGQGLVEIGRTRNVAPVVPAEPAPSPVADDPGWDLGGKT